jgi:HTH-type transcriptional regulator / antitoxin HigA
MALVAPKIRVKDDYLELVKRFPLTPLRTESQYKAAVKVMDSLSIIDEDKLTPGQTDYLLVLTDLVEKHESEKHAIDLSRLSGLDSLKFLLEENDMSASDLGRLLGNRQLGSAILRGDRQLSKEHIRKLCDRFKVSADLFV